MEVEVAGEDGQVDSQAVHFGMRDFTVQRRTVLPERRACYIRGVLLQPNFPVKLIEHPDREMMVRELTLAKAAGFNLLRSHLQPPLPEYLDLADQMGMLIYAETSLGWIKDNPRLAEHGRREIEAMIALDRNHPSVVFWGIYNENPTASAINGAQLAQFRPHPRPHPGDRRRFGRFAGDRPGFWLDRPGRRHPCLGVPASAHSRHPSIPGFSHPDPIIPLVERAGHRQSSRVLVDEQFGSLAVVDEFDRECRSYQGQIFVSELGCGGMADLDEQVAGFNGREDLLDARELKTLRDSLNMGFQERRLERIFGSPRGLYQEAQELQVIGNRQQVEALLANPRVSGYMITQLNDVAWEFHAGLLDVWRNPKPAYSSAKKFNQPHVVLLKQPAQPPRSGPINRLT